MPLFSSSTDVYVRGKRVKVEGKNVPRLGDMMVNNKQSSPNTPPTPEVQPPAVAMTVGWGDQEDDDNDLEEIEFIE